MLLLAAAAVALVQAGCGTGGAAASHDTSARVERHASLPIGRSQSYRVGSGSMEPTLPIGTRVVVKAGAPAVGAVVVFHPPEGAEQQQCGPKPHTVTKGAAACDTPIREESDVEFIKRVVAGPGDEIYIRAGHVYRKADGADKFMRESDPYIRACGTAAECNFPAAVKVPAGDWFMMGDNRGASDDSRFYGPVPQAWIVGTAHVAKD